jgi:hypothetical protein
VGKLKERNHLEDLSVEGRMTLKRTLNKHDARVWASFIWLGRGTNCRLFSHGKKPFNFSKCSEFLNS